GMVFQNYSLFPHLSVGANVEFPLRQRGVGKVERRRRAMEALDAVELGHRADATPDQLSGGQQQRVALARALVFEPALLLMDEPFGALDRGLRERMQLEVRRIHQQLGVTILFVTHDQQEALTMSDRIAIFNQGRIEQLGTPEDLYDRPASHFVATFLGESTVLSGEAHSGTLTLDTGHHVSLGDHSVTGPARLVLRPERLRIGSAETAGSSLGGRVRDVVYLGADRRVEIETDAGLVVVRVSADVASPHSGDLVHVHWDPADAHLYPAA
ncbi:MAG: ABC transporter ATP-binding protein, partial [Microcella sp.]